MDALMLITAIGLIPVVLALIFRVSGVFLFLSIAAGYLLVMFVGDDAGLALGMAVRTGNVNMIAQLILLLLPVGLSILLLKKTLPRHKVLLHMPLHVVSGLALAVLALPLLDSNAQQKVFANQYGGLLREYQDIFVAAAAAGAVLIMWLTYRHQEGRKHKKHY